MSKDISIYCDGAYSSLRDKGGWAFVVLENGIKIYSKFYFKNNTTNNRMEIQSCIEACSWAIQQSYSEITIYSDSMYLIGTMTKGWKKNKNHDLWILMDQISKKLKINFEHVKGHAGNVYNELCDALANQGSHLEIDENG